MGLEELPRRIRAALVRAAMTPCQAVTVGDEPLTNGALLMAKMDQQGTQDQYRHLLPAGGDGQENVSAFVGRGVEFKGTIIYDGTIQIDGILEGEIQTSGCLLVGDGAVIDAATIVVDNGLIVAAGEEGGNWQGVAEIDAAGKTVLPGLIDTHVHLLALVAESAETVAKFRQEELPAILADYLALGVTTIRSTGDPLQAFTGHRGRR